ncbi:SusC/RagA family TonB-linked outer membrane protein [Membranicola marinus]|uniref:SusC/RagA family TonB-linked outer membrane protein n=1 Tax=Membranihabitans marinus TaxID=1227546 RepID=A0A953HX40_9BACT|nr:SusC/RagA family TonB-linked outer membrane protein [Membranihabitans marinus]MBY5959388.1 SusC/RagA family TonB-linked outer membrane protein [Membranihabitans marinus]
MKVGFTFIKYYVSVLVLVVLMSTPYSLLAYQGEPMALEEAIQRISIRYDVYFTYNKSLIKDHTVEYDDSGDVTLSEAVEQVLSETSLRYRIHENKYVIIYRSDREGISSLKKMARHLDDLILTEEKRENNVLNTMQQLSSKNKMSKIYLKKHRMVLNVSGTVTDETGGPLIGVNIKVKGTNKGTSTDLEGRFIFRDVNEQATLVFSYVGYQTQQVELKGRTNISVTMTEDLQTLDEVVVVGYGTQKKSDVTGSVVSFDTEILESRPQTNLIQALQGNVPGMTVTTSGSSAEDGATILIRGQNSITASNSPLVIMDGVPYNGSFSEINPNDVKRIEVLKDASSTAIYGSRGANGVILITTKSGQAGKMRINYSGMYSFDNIAHLPDMQNASEYWADRIERNVINVLTQPSNTESLRDRLYEVFNGEDTEISAFMEGYPGQTWDGFIDNLLSQYPDNVHDRGTLLSLADDLAYPTNGRDIDWIDLATRTGHKQQHSLSVSGGTEQTKYYLSGIYTNTTGIARGDKFEKMTFRVNLDQRLLKGLHYGTNTQIGFFDRGGHAATWGGNSGAFMLSPLYVPFNENGTINLSPIPEDTKIQNPLEPLLFENEDNETRVITNHYLDWEIPGISGLKYKLNTGFTWNANDNKTYKGLNTVTGRIDGGNLHIGNFKDNSWIIENILSYHKEMGLHSLFFTGLYSAQENKRENNRINGRGFANDVMSFFQPAQAQILTADAAYARKGYISQMLRANYSYDNRYLITATLRRDGYSAFGDDTKFGLFPSVALGWNLANESFFADMTAFDQLKLRLSYGENGNEAIGPYSTLPRMSSKNYISPDQTQLFGFFPQRLSNPSLGWETTKSLNAGIDFSLKSGRFSGSLDVYTSRTSDLLLNETISAINGTTSILRNIGETLNHGAEVQLSSINMSSRDFSWETIMNFSTYQSEIVQVGLKDDDGAYIDDVASQWFIGHPVNVNFDYEVDRILQKEDFMVDGSGVYILDENNNYQLRPEVAEEIVLVTNTARPGQPILRDVNGDGVITGSDDKVIHGNRNPDFLAGLTNTVRYKSWSFTVFLNGVWGVTKANGLINSRSIGPRRKLNINYWSPENPVNTYPGINAGSQLNVPGYAPYHKADFIRLQDISLSYKVPGSTLIRWPVSGIEGFINVKNAYTFTSWQGLDPEYSSQSGVPRARSFIFGLRLTL